jgi:L,D-transpeptidase ErfK/SrfK
MTFPVGVVKQGWATPLGAMKIIDKIVNPTWIAPKDILKALAKEGYTNVPASIPPGPQDPLGDYAMRLSNPAYLIHGTNDPASIGTQASSGCIRLYPEDIEQLFQAVPEGTEVHIIDQPYVLGWYNNEIYLAVFPTLEDSPPLNFNQLEKSILHRTKYLDANINWRKVAYITLTQEGTPQSIGTIGS